MSQRAREAYAHLRGVHTSHLLVGNVCLALSLVPNEGQINSFKLDAFPEQITAMATYYAVILAMKARDPAAVSSIFRYIYSARGDDVSPDMLAAMVYLAAVGVPAVQLVFLSITLFSIVTERASAPDYSILLSSKAWIARRLSLYPAVRHFLLAFVLDPFLFLHPALPLVLLYHLYTALRRFCSSPRPRARLIQTRAPLYLAVRRLGVASASYIPTRLQRRFCGWTRLAAPRTGAPPSSEQEVFDHALKHASQHWCRIAWPHHVDTSGMEPFLLLRHGPLSPPTSFRLGLRGLLFETTTLNLPSGQWLSLTSGERDALVRHLDLSFTSFSQYLPRARLRDHPLWAYGVTLHQLSFAIRRRLLLLLARIPFLTFRIHSTFPCLASETQHDLLSSTSLFARRCLGLGLTFNPDIDLILAPSELYADKDLQAFLTALDEMLSAANRAGMSPSDVVDAFERAFSEACEAEVLGRKDDKLEVFVLDAVLAWKEVKLIEAGRTKDD